MQAGQFVQVIEERQGLKVGCIRDWLWQGFITDEQLKQFSEPLRKSGYGEYLLDCLNSVCSSLKKNFSLV
jgi:glucose-1-phosphate thymidylyltransferase